ncbi:MAG TPA: hypothetical protein DCX14_12340 [Flavobacteriales bacterium]|jgi:hypothetical protein|nr:hypothetical protein [Flavobacteriales bacterium]
MAGPITTRVERSQVEGPLWRKKVDSTLLKEHQTPIPVWVLELWRKSGLIVPEKKGQSSKFHSTMDGRVYSCSVKKRKKKNGYQYYLSFDNDLGGKLRESFLMTFMRSIEAELSGKKAHQNIEAAIPFWEFLDIEFIPTNLSFKLTAHYTIPPQFPNLFARLSSSAALKAIDLGNDDHEDLRIHKQGWASREDYKQEIGAFNVIYTLLDTKAKLIYVGEAKDLKKRFDKGHDEIREWDFYRFNVLPRGLSDRNRLELERMAIRDLASLIPNNTNEDIISVSDFKLVNRKIDT